MPGLGPAAHSYPEVATLDVDPHRAERDAPGHGVLLLDDAGLRGDRGLRVPRVGQLVVGGLGQRHHLAALFAPGYGQPLLFEDAPRFLVAVLVNGLLGLEHQHAELAPAHRRKAVPMQADVPGVGGDGCGHKRTAGVGLKTAGVRVGQMRATGRAFVGRADADLVQVPCAARLGVLGKPDLFPDPRLKVVALRAAHIPITLVGRLVQLMELLPGPSALG
ncbi:MAG: hypothetical protein AN484_15465 [Aphanizomenon flos-aquae WA102]|uniref:Uncharacterized protein n=1 Tax=Aphanizomenon flos-aquae WA102 TaxID=1710896 RepID=A0A1B7X0J2_APHFL|nr:MAG: hypothetical protein AN484_15465 [Aphanizomenon flos-aquae WA102]